MRMHKDKHGITVIGEHGVKRYPASIGFAAAMENYKSGVTEVAPDDVKPETASEPEVVAEPETSEVDIDALCDKYTKDKLKKEYGEKVQLDGRMSEKTMIEKILDAGYEL